MASLVTPWPVLQAKPDWRTIDFISDLHLQFADPFTYQSWQLFMQTTQSDAVFILGDLFEVWIGDDVIDTLVIAANPATGFEAGCAQVMKSASNRLNLFFMHGNRDFLVGPAFVKTCGMTLLNDPCVLEFAGHRWLLTHGDALCVDDTEYMQFRSEVRSAKWQSDFLGQPLAQRQAAARALRTESEKRKRSRDGYMDVDRQTSLDWLNAARANTLIHGHTHKPADHDLENGLRSIVLSDWDVTAQPARAQILRLSWRAPHDANSITIQRLAMPLP